MSKKKQHEEHIDETWLIPYSDLLTLLLALFVVLFAASNVDAAKFQNIAQGMYSAFNGGGAMPDIGDGLTPQLPNFPYPKEPDEQSPTPTGSGPGEPDPELQGLYDTLVDYVAANEDLSGNMGLSLSDDGVLITLSSDVWFASGSAALTPKMHSFAEMLANLLVENQKDSRDLNVVITGHTDNDPITGGAFQSNWDLSLARAYNFLKIMVENENFDPRSFSARGYGEFAPIAPNDTPENKQRNRRVEVLVSLNRGE